MTTGQERFPELAEAFAALERFVAAIDARLVSSGREPKVTVYVFGGETDDHPGVRVAELSSWWDSGGGKGAGVSFMRSDYESCGAILAAEDFLLCYGYEPEGWREEEGYPGCPDYDPANESRWKLVRALTAAAELDEDARDAIYRALAIPRTKP